MLHVYALTVPANTAKENPKTLDIEIDDDALLFVAVRFPPGPQALAGVSLWYGEEQIFPYPKGSWVVGDNEVIWDFILWKCPERPCPLTIKAYNIDDTYSHTCYIRIVSCDKVVFYGLKGFGRLLAYLEAIVGLFVPFRGGRRW